MNPPKYARVGTTEMIWIPEKKEYYRHGGMWSISVKLWHGRYVSKPIYGMPHTFMWEVVEITEEEWKKGNEGYLGALK